MSRYPASRIQEQFLVSASLMEASPAYHMASLTRLQGPLEVERLREAWARVFRATEVYRFPASPEAEVTLPWVQVAMPDHQVAAAALAEAERPFDLETPPLIRFVLYQSTSDLFHLLMVFHHAVIDLFTETQLTDQLGRAYEDPNYRPEVVPYSQFVETENRFLQSPAGKKAQEYFIGKLTAGTETLRLPGETWTPQPFAGQGSRRPWVLPPPLRSKLGALESQGRAPFLFLLSAYAVLLSRLSGQKKFAIGVPLGNRQGFENLPLAGPCVNVLPVVAEVGAGATFSEVYEVVRREMLGNHRHQSYPFLEIVRHMPPGDRDPLRPRLLQAGFTNKPYVVLNLSAIVSQPVELDRTGAQMDLFFTWWKAGDDWAGHWEYNGASFGAAEVDLWIDAYNRLVEAFLNDQETVVGRVRLTDQALEDRLSSGKTVDYPLDRSMTSLLREAYATHSAETALVYRGEATSYAQFAAGTAKVAARIHRDFGSGGRVVLLLDRSPEMLYAVHGTAQSGNAYVPLGIDWPESRIADILDDIRPCLVLTQASYQSKLSMATCPVELVSDLVAGPVTGFPEVTVAPQDALYILYTSGTTGRPKGAELPHAGIVNRLLWMQDEYRLKPKERALLKTPYTFDVSGWELLWPFLVGTTLVIAEEHQHKDPREILDLIRRESVRIVHFVPSMLSHFLDQEGLDQATSLKDVVASGEALTTEVVGRFYQRLPQAKLHNLYGPTEASIDVSYWPCSPDDIRRGTVPIGWPIANIRIWVLDEAGVPCPPLVRGEIFLGGVGLAKGYWNREELTRERFITTPLGRLYKTGDWGRFGLDGAIEYLERKDNQVKIRGLRVELGEIETALRELPTVENAIVKKGKTPSGAECLIAYYVTRDGLDIPIEAVTASLRDRLPGAIVPESYLRLKAFPRSENGKIDRKALPDTVAQEPTLAPAAAALTGIPGQIAGLWAQVIGQDGFDPAANFFDAGGSSLSLLGLRTLMEKSFGVSVRIAELFQNPTIAGMTALVSRNPAAEPGSTTSSAQERAQKQKEKMAEMARRRMTK